MQKLCTTQHICPAEKHLGISTLHCSLQIEYYYFILHSLSYFCFILLIGPFYHRDYIQYISLGYIIDAFLVTELFSTLNITYRKTTLTVRFIVPLQLYYSAALFMYYLFFKSNLFYN